VKNSGCKEEATTESEKGFEKFVISAVELINDETPCQW
jgi:hypothetical protein